MSGYIYCFSNKAMPGLLKVGMSERTPEIILNEANKPDTWRPPMPYEIVVAKKVLDPKQKEITLHKLLSQYTERTSSNHEFFRVSEEEVKTFFDFIDDDSRNVPKKTHRDMSKCFSDGQRVRHTIGINKTWIGIYDASKDEIICDTKSYKSLSRFAGMHYSIERPDRGNSANGWAECECEVNGKWISTYSL